MKNLKLAMFLIFLFGAENASALDISHEGAVLTGIESNFTFAKSIWTKTAEHDDSFTGNGEVNFLLIDDIALSGSLQISSPLSQASAEISLYRLDGTGSSYTSTHVKTWSGEKIIARYYIEEPGEYLVQSSFPGESHPYIAFDFFPDNNTGSCINLAPRSSLTCDESWLPAYYRKEVDPWMRGQFNNIQVAIGEVNAAKQVADYANFVTSSAIDAVQLYKGGGNPKRVIAKKVKDLAFASAELTIDDDSTQDQIDRVETYISQAELIVDHSLAIVNLSASCGSLNAPACTSAFADAGALLVSDAVAISESVSGIYALSELSERFNERRIAWRMLEQYIKNSYGNYDSLAVIAGLDPSENPSIYQIIDGVAESLGYENKLVKTVYDLEKVNELFNSGVFDFGDWVTIRKKMPNPLDDVDRDGIKNIIDPFPNKPLDIEDPIDTGSNRSPSPSISVSALHVEIGQTVFLNANESIDPDGDELSASWRITGPGGFSKNIGGMGVSFTASQSGTYRAALTVSDSVTSATASETISVTDPSQTFFDPEAISRVNVTMGANRCGDVIQLYNVTLPSGVYWDSPRLWATTYDQDANNPTPQYFMMGLNELPSTDRGYSDEKCANFGLTSERGFNYDFLMDMRGGTYTNSGKVSHGKTWNRLITPGTTVYLAVGAADDYPFDIEQVTLETNILYDRDGDGVSDNKDAFPDLASEAYDSDGDGVGDNADAFPNDSSAWLDTDGDGCPDSITGESPTGLIKDDSPNLSDVCVDSDSDQVDDRFDDAFPDDPSEWADSDGDGIGDNSDAFPTDHAASVDSDNDGYPDFWNFGKLAADSTTGLSLDLFPEDPTEWRDSDFDGVGDNADWAVNDHTEWADTDGDGVGDNADAAPNDPGRSTNSSPVLSEIAPLVVFTGTNSVTPVTATDSDGDNVTLQTINAPSFLSLTAGELELAAVEGDEGNYEFLIVATDEFGGFNSLRVSATVEAVVNEDTVPPIISAPVEGLVLNLSEGNSVAVTESRVNTFLDSASATDDIDGAVAITNDAPEMFGLGTTTITFSATDAAGNTGTATASVTVTSNDNDSDGLPNEFETANGLDPNEPSDAVADLDGDGRTNLEEYLEGADIAVDDVKPVLSIPADLVVDSGGPLTAVDLGMATASDVKDGVIVPTVDNPGPYAPGRHVLTWSATDEAGNTAKSEQIVDVIPIASFTVPQTIYEGTQAFVSVTLNGPAAVYPVRIPFTVSGSAESPADHSLDSGEIIIEADTSGSIEVPTVDDDVWEGDETIVITMGAVTNAVKGAVSSHTITLREENIAPRVNISVTQNGTTASTVYADAGPVVLTAVVNDPNPDDSHTFDWSMTSNNLIPEEGYVSETFTFNPVSVSEGLYPLTVNVTDSGEGLLGGSNDSLIRVEATAPILSETEDTDSDGTPDALEGAGDSDGNRVPDYLDPTPEPGLLPAGDVSIPMQAESGVSLKLGDTTFAAGNNVAYVTLENLMNHGGEAGGAGIATADSGYQYPSGIFDFIASSVDVGGSVRIVIPQTSAIPSDAVYRKYKRETGWTDFAADANNAVSSAPGSLGNCPAPGDLSYASGLVQGNYCVQLTIQDGGLNDADGVANGVVKDPGGVAVRLIPEPLVTAEGMPVSNTTFNVGDGEMVVLGFMLTSDSTDAEVNRLTFSATGEIQENADVGMVRLYRDDNKNGIPEAAERVAEGSYDNDDGDITFDLPEAYQLPFGDTHFLVTYQF